ncbi:MAG: cytochrome c [Deltaproteobacteria bacterium]|nr:cytochrome c [Deltaproteobacteria bacterium]
MQKKSKHYLSLKWVSVLVLSAAFLGACGGKKEKPPWEYMPNMLEGPSIKAQEALGKVPPEGTVPRGFEAYPYKQDQGDLAGAELANPLPVTKEVLLKGQAQFNIYCLVCHGERGKGDGSIVPKFPRPPSLQSEKVKGWSDGRIFHVITMGQNLMPSYASQIKAEDRWAIIKYIRALQRADQPTPEDIEEMKKALKEGKVL